MAVGSSMIPLIEDNAELKKSFSAQKPKLVTPRKTKKSSSETSPKTRASAKPSSKNAKKGGKGISRLRHLDRSKGLDQATSIARTNTEDKAPSNKSKVSASDSLDDVGVQSEIDDSRIKTTPTSEDDLMRCPHCGFVTTLRKMTNHIRKKHIEQVPERFR